MSGKTGLFYEFGSFRVDTEQRILFRENEPQKLAPKTFDLLLTLIVNANRIISKEELMREIWANSFVEEANLTVHISVLRKILNGEGGACIETVPKRGYRFTANVKEITRESNDSSKSPIKAHEPYSDAKREKTGEKVTFAFDRIKESSEYKPETQPEPFFAAESAENLEHEAGNGARNVYKTKRSNRNKILFSIVILFPVAVAALFALYKFSDSRRTFQAMKITPISDTGKTVEAAISPDGKYLAHIVREPGKQSLHVKHIATNSSVQIVAAMAASFSPLTFSKDGGYIYYAVTENNAPGVLYRIPVLGGEPKKILENVAGAVSFAPDGERFAFVRNVSPFETALMIADINGGAERQISVRSKPEHFHPSGAAWSPDKEIIACSGGSASGERLSNIYAVSIETGATQPISNRKWRAIERAAWLSDGSGLVAGAMDVEGQEAFQIWQFPFPSGEARRITNDLNDYGGVNLTADSKTLVTVQFQGRRNIWLVPNLETKQAVLLTEGVNDSFRFVSWTPDKKIIYPSLSSGTRDIWIMNADGSNRKQLTATPHNDILPTASGDNRYILFASNRSASGTVNIWRMNMDGTNSVQLTFGADESQPVGTPDGKWVIYTAGGNDSEQDKRTVWKVPIQGGEPVQLTFAPSYGASVSPDGKRFACRYKDNKDDNKSASWKVAVIPIEGGQPEKFLDIVGGSPLRWSTDGGAITFIKTQNGVSNIWSQPLNGEPARQLTDFNAEQIYFFDWSNDNQLICSRGVTTQQAITISDFR